MDDPTELAPMDAHAANTDDRPIEAIDGIQDVPQEPISEDDAGLLARTLVPGHLVAGGFLGGGGSL